MPTLNSLLRSDVERFNQMRKHSKTQAGLVSMWLTCFSPRLMPVALYRISHALHSKGFSLLSKGVALLNFVLFGIEISPQTEIGPGLFLPHTQGTVLGARRIGSNATIFQQVTLGAKDCDLEFRLELRPELGDHVTVGAGAKIIGGIRIGNSVTVGANSVVLKDVPDGATCVGIPARILTQNN